MPNKHILQDTDGLTPKLETYKSKLDPDFVMKDWVNSELNPAFVLKDKVDKFTDFRQHLEYFSHHDECYTYLDLKTLEIQWSYGFKRWLGYDERIEGADYDHMTKLVHPFIASWYTAFLKSMYLVFAENKKLTDLKPRFVINIPVKPKNGKRYLLVKQMSMPYGINEEGEVFGFINSYSIFGDYQAEPLSPQIYGADGKPDPVEMEKVREHMYSCITDDNTNWFLTDHQIDIIETIRQLREKGEKVTNANLKIENLQPKSVSATVGRIKNQLLKLIDKAALLEGEVEATDLLDGKKNLELIEFMDQSGILEIIIQCSERYHGKKPA